MLASPPLGLALRLFFDILVLDSRVLLGRAPRYLGSGRRLRLLGEIVFTHGLFDGDTLVYGLAFGFFKFNLFVMREMLDIFGVVVRIVCLGFRRRMVLFWCGVSRSLHTAILFGDVPSWWRKNSVVGSQRERDARAYEFKRRTALDVIVMPFGTNVIK